MSDPATISSLLQITLTGTTQNIKSSQLALQQMQVDMNFLPHLMMVLKEQTIPKNVRKAAAIYTKRYAKNRLTQKDQTKINATAQLLLSQLSQNGIDLQLKRYVSSTIEFLLINDHRQVIRTTLNAFCIKILEASSDPANNQSTNYEFIGLFLQVLMSSFVHLTKQINIFIQKTLVAFSGLNLKVFQFVQSALEKGNIEQIMSLFKVLKIYSNVTKLYCQKILLSEIDTVKQLYDQKFTLLINKGLQFTLKNNQFPSTLLYKNQKIDQNILEIYHSIKADYIQSLKYYMRTIFVQFKDERMITASPILKAPALIPSMINALFQLFKSTSYHKIKSPSLIKLVQQILNLEIIAVRNPFYFQYFNEYQSAIIHGCILKVLSFSPLDCNKFHEDPEQFINSLLQIIEMDSTNYYDSKQKQALFPQNIEDIEEYSNLRTLGSVFLQAYCKKIDGSFSQIFNFSIGVLKGQIASQFPKSLLLLMLSILRDQVLKQQASGKQILQIVGNLLRSRDLPEAIQDIEAATLSVFQQNIEYLMILLTAFRYLSKVQQVDPNDIGTLYKVVYHILITDQISQALKIQAFDLTISLSERNSEYQIPFIELMNIILHKNTVNAKLCLQTLQNLFKYATNKLEESPITVQTVQNLAKVVQNQLTKSSGYDQLLINKCWNVIGNICQNDLFIPKFIPQIQQAVMPLLRFIDGKNNYDYEENILIMMSSFIQKSKVVTENQLRMFQIIPVLFYNQYEYNFAHAFEAINIFIYYGSSIIISNPAALKAIIDMAACSMNTVKVKKTTRNEAENCEGVLILQSLMLSCGNSFSAQIWVQLAKMLDFRLENPTVKGDILKSNIIASLSLILMLGYKSFSNEDCDLMMNKIIQNAHCFTVKYSVKLAIVALSEILSYTTLQFVVMKYTFLMDIVINLLQAHEQKDIFDKNPITNEQKDYDAQMMTLKNMVTLLDEIEHFKTKLIAIKQSNPALLQKTLLQLPERKQQYLRKIMSVSKIVGENRVIFKIKK